MTKDIVSVRQANFAAWTNAIMNVILAVGKGVVGVIAGSQALIADAVHSAADVVGSIAVLIGLRIARKPPDDDHPYGHGKAELIAASIVSGFLIAAGFEVAYGSIKSLFVAPVIPEIMAAYTAFIAMVIKEILYRYNYRLGRKMNSQSLVASAYDHRSDVFSSLAALIGIILSLFGAREHITWLLHMDGIAGAFVAVLVFKMAFEIAKDSLRPLMDRVLLAEKDRIPYFELIQDVEGVQRIDDLRVRDHGQYVIVDVKICVNADLSVEDGHQIAAQVKHSLRQNAERVHDVFVHVNPFYETGDPRNVNDDD